MKLAIMQPYFFPGLGYFDLIHAVDRWVVFDTAQYLRHGWANRNRIHHPSKGWQYFIVPLADHARETPIQDIEVHPDPAWKQKILGQLTHYKKRAPHYKTTVDLVRECLDEPEPRLARLSVRCLEAVCARLGLTFDYSVHSEMDLSIGAVDEPGDWALRISEAMGAAQYINFPGGEHLFDRAKFEASGIDLVIRRFDELEYDCAPYEFIAGLSIVDVLMFNSAESIRAHLA